MDENIDPWDNLRQPVGSLSQIERRADPDHSIDFFRGRSSDGRYLFILKGIGNNWEKKLPTLAGIKIRREPESRENQRITLELSDNEMVSLFRALTRDLLQATADLYTGSSDLAANRLIIRLERWQAMLRKSRENLLTRQAMIGLIGELLFIRDVLAPAIGIEQSIQAWRGPHDEEQDFAYGNILFEVKTQLSSADQYLQVNSEAQLDNSSGQIIVNHKTLVASESSDPHALTLNQIVDDLRTECSSTTIRATENFEVALLNLGYKTREEYDESYWRPARTRFFEVQDEFPRFVPASIPPGVSKLRYRISLGAIEKFERDSEWVNGAINGQK